MSHYIVLGIGINASDEEIKKAYQKLAMAYHPDRHNGSKKYQEKFQQINYAYQILSDYQNKKQYDAQYINIKKIENSTNQSRTNYTLTAPYNSELNVFNADLKEVFELLKGDSPRILKQLLGLQPKLSLEGHYYQKYTPLMEAAFLGSIEMVKFICKTVKDKYTKNNTVSYQYKQYLNQINIEGKTAIIIATLSNETPEVIKFLIEEGCDVNIKDREGKDIFYYAPYSPTELIEDYLESIRK